MNRSKFRRVLAQIAGMLVIGAGMAYSLPAPIIIATRDLVVDVIAPGAGNTPPASTWSGNTGAGAAIKPVLPDQAATLTDEEPRHETPPNAAPDLAR